MKEQFQRETVSEKKGQKENKFLPAHQSTWALLDFTGTTDADTKVTEKNIPEDKIIQGIIIR